MGFFKNMLFGLVLVFLFYVSLVYLPFLLFKGLHLKYQTILLSS